MKQGFLYIILISCNIIKTYICSMTAIVKAIRAVVRVNSTVKGNDIKRGKSPCKLYKFTNSINFNILMS